ncbi:MAG: helix-turn-helix domain-containing protein, partial [Treponema sp.]|nr:helix-turn-helix domain-containing protein [Treponema sp.]
MSEMLKAFKTRLYHTAEQAAFFEQNIGNCRFVYNYALGASIQEYKASKKNFSKFEMMKRITQLKKEEGKKWLKLSDSISLQASIEDLDKAYQGFFKEGKGFPNFHKKGL